MLENDFDELVNEHEAVCSDLAHMSEAQAT